MIIFQAVHSLSVALALELQSLVLLQLLLLHRQSSIISAHLTDKPVVTAAAAAVAPTVPGTPEAAEQICLLKENGVKNSTDLKYIVSDIGLECAQGWEKYGSKCYRVYTVERSWPQALLLCSR
ncbi:unnamed protein product [Gongylonema pulchrum]|uniref:SRCR domain-containing protein n=1 Tax=Gongylonema pulchrum TaxID=637853 RepID=A0A183D1F9_9BILA|nr:unnamed protein product [Gongylonema pulchrum]